MTKKKETIKVKVPKPRNPLVPLVMTKKAGRHEDKRRKMKYRHIEDYD